MKTTTLNKLSLEGRNEIIRLEGAMRNLKVAQAELDVLINMEEPRLC